MKILVLDDDISILKTLKKVLTRHNYEVDCSDNAKQAVQMAEKGDYDFVLVDYKLPENDGIWFMENTKLPKKTKALLITAYVNRDVINKMFTLGASGYLVKPFDNEELLKHLDYHST